MLNVLVDTKDNVILEGIYYTYCWDVQMHVPCNVKINLASLIYETNNDNISSDLCVFI